MINVKNKLLNARRITTFPTKASEDGLEVRLDKRARGGTEEKKINEEEIVLEVMG